MCNGQVKTAANCQCPPSDAAVAGLHGITIEELIVEPVNFLVEE
jgi:hypothetical protein